MVDLLAHMLFSYSVGSLYALWNERINREAITMVMVGAVIPDLNHLDILLPSRWIEEALGIPFSWDALQTGGGVLVSITIISLLVVRRKRFQAFVLLWIGAFSHLVLDGLLWTPDGYSQSILWPVTRYQPPTPGFFTSYDPKSTLFFVIVAAASWLVTRHVGKR